MTVDVTADLSAELPVDALFDVLEDLGTYPSWLDIVSRAEPTDSLEGEDLAWSVDLRGQVGPFRRSKRLRMVRTVHDRARTVRFERRELDGRSHSDWVMTADLTANGSSTPELRMRLHYGGNLWVPLLDRVLADEIERSRPRLVDYVSGRLDG